MPVVELLQAHHDRNSFDCGKALLNDFLRNQARQNADRNVGVTHVAVESIGATEILGYYTLVTRTVDRELIPTKHLARGPVGVVLLGRLAVDLKSQKRGLGKLMLLTAIRKTADAAKVLGIHSLVLDAMDESARNWYLSLEWGFSSLLDDPLHLFLPIQIIQKLEL